jgi:hypothetical protein
MGIRSERWLIKPLACPRPIRYCPACGAAREFICSERFRVNAQKKVIDVWLHYRCSECSDAWKFSVLERQRIDSFDATLYEAFVRHDPATVWRYAFDMGRLRPHVMRVDANVSVVVERSTIDGDSNAEDLCVHLEVPFACDMRLDRLLATELRVSRATIQRRHELGQLRVLPEQSNVLSRRARTGQQLVLLGWCES